MYRGCESSDVKMIHSVSRVYFPFDYTRRYAMTIHGADRACSSPPRVQSSIPCSAAKVVVNLFL